MWPTNGICLFAYGPMATNLKCTVNKTTPHFGFGDQTLNTAARFLQSAVPDHSEELNDPIHTLLLRC